MVDKASHVPAGDGKSTGILYVLPRRDFFARGRSGRVTHAIGVAGGLAANGVRVVVLSGSGIRSYAPDFGAGIRIEELVPARGRTWFGALRDRMRSLLLEDTDLRDVIVRYAVSNGVRFRRLIRTFPERRWVFEVNSLAYHQYEALPVMVRRLILRSERRVLRNADALYVVSRNLKGDLCAGRSEIDGSRTFVVPNAGHPDLAQRAATADRDASPANTGRFVYLGMFCDYYDFAFVLKAFRRLLKDRPAVELHFYGAGQQSRFVRTRAMAIPNTHLHGRYDLVEMIQRGEIGTDWIFLLPYRPGALAAIGSPTKLFEYMALGRPILASAVGQLPDVLKDGETGSIYDPGRIESLVGKMKHLLDHPELRAQIGAAAREAFLREHTWTTRMSYLREELCSLP